MIRSDGAVKVLDFGLARMARAIGGAERDTTAPAALENSTVPGRVMGTAPYMSPEQTRGNPLDKRTDIWALGCILYECLSGRRPFDGQTTTDVLARIVSSEPDYDVLPDETPADVVHVLRRCLEKDPRRRLRDAGEVRVTVEDLPSPSRSGPGGSSAIARPPQRATWFPWMLVTVLAIVVAYGVFVRPRAPANDAAPSSEWEIPLAAGEGINLPNLGGNFDYSRLVTISRDGARVAFSVSDSLQQGQIYFRDLGAAGTHAVAGTRNARAPFFSPDGAWVGFLTANRTIEKVALAGGSPQAVCDIGQVIHFDASWSPDGHSIVFATDDGLWRVDAAGGAPEKLTTPDPQRDEVGHHSPRVTPDGQYVLFTVSVRTETSVAVLSLATGTWKVVVRNAALGAPLGDDRLAFARGGELFIVPYDTDKHATEGSAVSVQQDVLTSPGLGGVVLTHFDVSDSGTLVFVPSVGVETVDRLMWVDRSGRETPIAEGRGTWVHPRLSPDAGRISLDIHTRDGMRDVYVYELDRGQLNRLTQTGATWESEWNPDGRRLAVMSGAPAGQWSLHAVDTDFSSPPDLLSRSSQAIPACWTPDGADVIYTEWVEGGIWRVPGTAGGQPVLIVGSPRREVFPRLSPDGRWMAYVAEESGRLEIFVQSYPEVGARHKVSIDGGGEPVWSHDGRELFFRRGQGVYVVDVTGGTGGFSSGRPRLLFSGNYDTAPVGHQHYDVSRDGRRFLMIRHGESLGPAEVRVVLNWAQHEQ
jgi:serine/threonine-protein kinase